MAQQFGYAVLRAQSQTAEGLIPAAAPAQPSFLAGSECFITASFFDNTGAPMVPQALTYQINDVATGATILAPTAVSDPMAVQQVAITAAQNAMVSNSQNHETHEVIFAITDQNGQGPFLARCLFDILRAPGV